LLNLTGWLTQNPKEVEQMFRRMVFNVLAKNRDDHAKNFSFIYTESGWYLAPAYDLTYSPSGYNGEHATTVNGLGRPTEEDMITVGMGIRMSEKRCCEIIEECKFHVKELY
jgi:serine/threonine-protein kinase HipA